MERALIVSRTEKSIAYFTELLVAASVTHITTLPSCTEARRLILERDFDLVIINAPLKDETGESLSRHIASKGLSQVILVVKAEFFDAVSAICEVDGVLTIAKPMNKAIFWSALMLAKSAQNRIKRMQAENTKLTQTIEDIKIVNKAKYILISQLNMSEQDAHKYIEKQAMDTRSAKRVIAENIIKTYKN